MIIDTHIHLSHFLYENEFPFLSYKDGVYSVDRGTREQLTEKIKEAGITACIDPAIDIHSNERLLALAYEYPGFIYPAVGVHPTRTYRYITVDDKGVKTEKTLCLKQIKAVNAFAGRPSVVAVGETGLDYYRNEGNQHRIRQKIWFIAQIIIAHRNRLPLVLHIRQADKDAIRILRLFRPMLHGGVCHCFTGGAERAAEYTKLGFCLGIGAALLKEKGIEAGLEQAVAQTPLEYILTETDGPYVKPDGTGFSGKQLIKARNTSLILPAVINRIAQLKGITPEEAEKAIAENAARVFGTGK